MPRASLIRTVSLILARRHSAELPTSNGVSSAVLDHEGRDLEALAKGSTHYVLLKNVKVSSTGSATYRYKVGKKGTRYHRVKFLGNATYLPAPIKQGIALRVR